MIKEMDGLIDIEMDTHITAQMNKVNEIIRVTGHIKTDIMAVE